jgi:hypothetical protein
MVLLKHFIIGISLRIALFAFPEIVELLGNRLELSTALTRYSEVHQEVHWPSAEGSHRPPLVAELVKRNVTGPFFFILLDCIIAFLLYASVKLHSASEKEKRDREHELLTEWRASGRPRLVSDDGNAEPDQEDSDDFWPATWIKNESGDLSSQTLPETIASIYLLSPFTILTCGAKSFAPLTFLFAIASITFAQQRSPLLAGAFLASTCYLDGPSFFAILAIPVLFQCDRRTVSRIKASVSFAVCLGGLLVVSYLLNDKSWSFIGPSYVWVFSVPDSRPNVGMWWYLMAEVFERYRSYFLFLLHSFIYLSATPLVVYLYRRPVLHAHFGLALLQTFQPYPELFHVFTTLLLLFMHPQFVLAIMGLAPILLVTCFSLALQPVMLFTWLDLGSGNANYYYFQCLIVNGMLCLILIQFYVAVVTRDAVLRRVERFLWTRKNA